MIWFATRLKFDSASIELNKTAKCIDVAVYYRTWVWGRMLLNLNV